MGAYYSIYLFYLFIFWAGGLAHRMITFLELSSCGEIHCMNHFRNLFLSLHRPRNAFYRLFSF